MMLIRPIDLTKSITNCLIKSLNYEIRPRGWPADFTDRMIDGISSH